MSEIQGTMVLNYATGGYELQAAISNWNQQDQEEHQQPGEEQQGEGRDDGFEDDFLSGDFDEQGGQEGR